MQKLALLHGERLGQGEQAIGCWRRILELEPKHGRAQRAVRDALLKARDWDGLEALYARVRDWEGLVDLLSHEADGTDKAPLKIEGHPEDYVELVKVLPIPDNVIDQTTEAKVLFRIEGAWDTPTANEGTAR